MTRSARQAPDGTRALPPRDEARAARIKDQHVRLSILGTEDALAALGTAAVEDAGAFAAAEHGHDAADITSGVLDQARVPEAFVVDSLFFSAVATDPATLLGYGTWDAEASGPLLVGMDTITVYVWRRTE